MTDKTYSTVVMGKARVLLVRSAAGDPTLGYVVAEFKSEDACRQMARLLNAAEQAKAPTPQKDAAE